MEYIDSTTPTEEAEAIIARMNEAEDNYFPHSFWEAQDVYIQMMTEKVDTKNLFTSECEPFRIPIFNAGGRSDLHSRAAAMERFKYWERRGKRCILLYLGDLAGCTSPMRSAATSPTWPAVSAWSPDKLIVDRFGIDKTFVNRHRMTLIENLHTSKKGGLPLNDPKADQR